MFSNIYTDQKLAIFIAMLVKASFKGLQSKRMSIVSSYRFLKQDQHWSKMRHLRTMKLKAWHFQIHVFFRISIGLPINWKNKAWSHACFRSGHHRFLPIRFWYIAPKIDLVNCQNLYIMQISLCSGSRHACLLRWDDVRAPKQAMYWIRFLS